ncbi:MAG: hypothetical protein EBW01_06125, partial [Proteobacteria bacterium]|nr:hypothetical protein [Pseudomonadota bacterium]
VNYIQEKYLMLYQIGLILMLVALALIIGKKFKKTDSDNDQLIYEDEMSSEELNKLDDEIN